MSKSEHMTRPLTEDDPAGTPVAVVQDDGEIWFTKTRDKPWRMGGHTDVVLLDGQSGGYMVKRCHVLPHTVEVKP